MRRSAGTERRVVVAALFAVTIAAHAGEPRRRPPAASTPAATTGSSLGPVAGSYALERAVIAGGGGVSSNAGFRVAGTLGQHDADPLWPSSGGVFALAGGFWSRDDDGIFASGFETP